MLFNSAEFLLVFFPVTLAGFALLALNSSWLATVWLALASVAFYGYWEISNVPLLLGSITLNLAAGRLIGSQQARLTARFVLTFAICADLALLTYFKYAQFAIETANQIGFSFAAQKIVLPIGISFFTFTQIAFLIDAYKGLVYDYSIGRYTLFVTYFPHLIAGPILHHGEMIPQFRKYGLGFQHIAVGLTVFVIGLFKKVVLADSAAVWVTPVFNAPDVAAAEAWGGVLAYAFQIYFDFSGYSDMAIGLSYMLGIRLPLNFNSPYKATSIIDFWRRWHITLSRFLKDYLYVPLGGNRKGATRRFGNLLATMVIGGLWHGAAWTFVAWGALHGMFLIINHGWRAFAHRCGIPEAARWRSIVSGPLTFASVLIAWVFFRAETFDQAVRLLKSMFLAHGLLPAGWLGRALSFFATPKLLVIQPWMQGTTLLIFLSLICWFLPNTQEFMVRHSAAIEQNLYDGPLQWRGNFSNALLIAVLAVTSFTLMTNHSPFLYFQF
jgi:alginate O-acetyltransferase complex protein AlgI